MTRNELAAIFGRNLKNLRVQAGYSQTEFAAIIKTPRVHLSAIELGKKVTSFELISRVIQSLKCKPQDLFYAEGIHQSIEDKCLTLSAHSTQAIAELVHEYKALKTTQDKLDKNITILELKRVEDRLRNGGTGVEKVDIHLLSLLPMLSQEAQTMMKEFAEGYLEKNSQA